MDPKEVNTPEGEMRFLMLREMFRAVALQSGWIHTVSNWALGTTGAYMGLLVANLDKIQPHLAKGWQRPVFGCALASAVTGIVSKFFELYSVLHWGGKIKSSPSSCHGSKTLNSSELFCLLAIRLTSSSNGSSTFTQMKGYPTNPKTIGEAIRKRCLDLDLHQIDVATLIGCDETTVVHWEKDHANPRLSHIPGIIQFLGYNPLPAGRTIAEGLFAHRRRLPREIEERMSVIGRVRFG